MHHIVSCDTMNQAEAFLGQISLGCVVNHHPGITSIISRKASSTTEHYYSF
jgi:hypothetical protein